MFFIVMVIIGVVCIYTIFSMKKSKSINEHIEKKFAYFDCKKCKNKKPNINIFTTPLNETFFKICNINNMSFIQVSCERCGYAEIYNYVIVNKEDAPWLHDDNVSHEYACSKCKNKQSKVVNIAVTGTGLSRVYDTHGGAYRVNICDQCGYSEFYELNKPSGSPGDCAAEMGKLAKEFHCLKCSCASADTAIASFTGGLLSRIMQKQYIDLIMVSCEKCKFTDVYDRKIRCGENIFALR